MTTNSMPAVLPAQRKMLLLVCARLLAPALLCVPPDKLTGVQGILPAVLYLLSWLQAHLDEGLGHTLTPCIAHIAFAGCCTMAAVASAH